MAKNQRSDGRRIYIKAGGARTSGSPTYEDGFYGYPVTDAATDAYYWLDISQREWEVTVSGGQTWAKGTKIYAVGSPPSEGTVALTSTPTSNTLVGKVARVAADTGPATGKVWMLTLPQQT